MSKLNNEEIKLSIISIIMFLLSMIIGITDIEIIKKVLLCVVAFLLGMQVQKTIYIIKERKNNRWMKK